MKSATTKSQINRKALGLAALALCTTALALGITTAATAAAAVTPAPAWSPIAASGPTNLAPGEEGKIAVYTQNVGGAPSSGTITLTDELGPGLLTSATPSGVGWSCLPAGAGQSTVSCTTSAVVAPGLVPKALVIPVIAGPEEEAVPNRVTVEGGGASAPGSFEAPVTISSTPAKPGVQTFTVGTYDADGARTTQAASHPYVGATAFLVNTVRSGNGQVVPAADPKTIEVAIPPGFLGNPTATPRCGEGLNDTKCPIESQVGLAQPILTTFGNSSAPDAVHSVAAPVGYPAKFTFSVAGGVFQVNALASLRSDEDYGIAISSPNTAQIESVYGAFFSIWGSPGDASHDHQRCVVVETEAACGPSAFKTAFLTMASDCAQQAAQPPFAELSFDTWLTAGEFEHQLFAVPAVTGCEELELETNLTFQPEGEAAASASGFESELTLPQEGLLDPALLATPPLRRAVVTLPAGVAINPASGEGLQACSEAQIGYRGNNFPEPNRIRFDKAPNTCPDASKVGTVEVKTALLENPLHGALYVAAQGENPFASLFAVYLVIEDPSVGINVKLPGELRADPVSGQLTAIFDDNPQVPIESLRLKLQGGDRGPLATPDTCGTFTTHGEFTPWSAPESGAATETNDSFKVSSGPGGAPCANGKAQRPFRPTFNAGTQATNAGAYSPLRARITRKDGEQELRGIEFTLPEGLTGRLAGIASCSDAAITAAEARSGKLEQANPSCPAASRVGTLTSAVGIGNAPIQVSGNAYLAGPYKGAPLSVVSIIPALAGPFDLGNVVVRAATYVNPLTAELTARADPVPAILKGVPVALRSVEVNLDRANFILNPTNCEPMSITGQLTGGSGALASLSNPFQVGNCEVLGFKPKLKLALKGGTERNRFPALTATLTQPEGQANIRSVQALLPHSEFLEQGHIGTVCTRVQFNADQCPAKSVYGHAEALTPLLDQPLSGPVYLRSNGGERELPDLVAALRGPASQPIEVDLVGYIDAVHARIRSTFALVPDAPVSKFTLRMKGGKQGLLVNSHDLCSLKVDARRATVRVIAQNGKRGDQFPVIQNGCGKKGKKHRHKSGRSPR